VIAIDSTTTLLEWDYTTIRVTRNGAWQNENMMAEEIALLALPVELIKYTASFLEPVDLLQLRLACKQLEKTVFEAFATAYLRHHQRNVIKPDSLRRLSNIASNHGFACRVESSSLSVRKQDPSLLVYLVPRRPSEPEVSRPCDPIETSLQTILSALDPTKIKISVDVSPVEGRFDHPVRDPSDSDRFKVLDPIRLSGHTIEALEICFADLSYIGQLIRCDNPSFPAAIKHLESFTFHDNEPRSQYQYDEIESIDVCEYLLASASNLHCLVFDKLRGARKYLLLADNLSTLCNLHSETYTFIIGC